MASITRTAAPCQHRNPPKVLRQATLQDHAKADENRLMSKMAFDTCVGKAEKHGVKIRLIRVRYSFDRSVLRILFAATLVAIAGPTGALDPHVDPSVVTGSCAACHRGHGESRSPMLPAAQTAVCLRCHGTQTEIDRAVSEGSLAPGVQPTSIDSALSQPFVHPMDDHAYSRWEPGVITCTSCHSPHRSSAGRATGAAGAYSVE